MPEIASLPQPKGKMIKCSSKAAHRTFFHTALIIRQAFLCPVDVDLLKASISFSVNTQRKRERKKRRKGTQPIAAKIYIFEYQSVMQ